MVQEGDMIDDECIVWGGHCLCPGKCCTCGKEFPLTEEDREILRELEKQ